MTYREQLRDFTVDVRELFVGERTLGDAIAPPVVFVIAQRWLGVGGAAAAALATAAIFVTVRWRRRASAAYAIGGVVTVGIAAFFALRSGQAEDFFLPGIISALGWSAAGAVSILVRRPFMAFASAFYRNWPLDWYWRDDVRPAYSMVSWWWVAFTFARGAIQWWLLAAERLELLLTFKLVTGWPLSIPLLFAGYVFGNRKLHALGGPNTDEFLAGADAPYAGHQHGF